MRKRFLLHSVLLALFVIVFYGIVNILLYQNGYIYGSTVDWLSQHIAYAEYIRDVIYETKNLFPDFSMHLSGGVNMAQLVYYGIYRPEILLSLFFPMVAMKDFLSVTAILWVIGSVELLYIWLRKEKVNDWIAFFVALLFTLAGPVLFHTHRHYMFINYLPGEILTFIGIHQYVEHRKSRWMIVGIVLMVLESYFFSVSALFMCGIYAIFCVLRKEYTLRLGIQELLCLLLHVGLALGIASFLLVPTAFSMLAQHRSAIDTLTLLSLLTPDLDMSAIIYTEKDASYAIGFSMIGYLAILHTLIQKDRSKRWFAFLVLIVAIFPIFCYVLNGMQYVRQKSLIPMLPLVTFIVGMMLDSILFERKKILIFLLIVSCIPLYYMQGSAQIFCLLEVILLCILLYYYQKKKKQYVLYPYLVFPLIACIAINMDESYVKISEYNKYENEQIQEMAQTIIEEDDGVYRFDNLIKQGDTINRVIDMGMWKTSMYNSNQNQDYTALYHDVMRVPVTSSTRANLKASIQPFFQSMMSVKYMMMSGDVPYGYETIMEEDEIKLVKNDNVMPMAYASSSLLSLEAFLQLSYPYTLDALYHQVIVDNDVDSVYESHVNTYTQAYDIVEQQNVSFLKINNGYRIVAKEDAQITISLSQPIKDQLLILGFSVGDVVNEQVTPVSITVNGLTTIRSQTNNIYKNNKDDFGYVLSSNEEWDTITIQFSKGTYSIYEPSAYIMDATLLSKHAQEVTALTIEENDDSVLAGFIDVENDGYFVTSLLYQDGFHVYVDGEEVSYEKVNTAFVGFAITQGEHQIVIEFEMPGKRLGYSISICAILIASGIYIIRRRKGYVR